MKKKIDLFWYWFIFVVAFVLCFFAINDKKVSAYHLNENGNLVSDNLINGNLFGSEITFSFNSVKSVTYAPYGFELVVSKDNVKNNVGAYFSLEKFGAVVGETYTLSFEISSNDSFEYFTIGREYDELKNCYSNFCYFTTTLQSNSTYVIYGNRGSTDNVNNSYTISNMMLYEGSYDVNKFFEPFGIWYSESNLNTEKEISYEEGYNAGIVVNNTAPSFYFDEITSFMQFRVLGETSYIYLDNASKVTGYNSIINFSELLGVQYPSAYFSQYYWTTIDLVNKISVSDTLVFNFSDIGNAPNFNTKTAITFSSSSSCYDIGNGGTVCPNYATFTYEQLLQNNFTLKLEDFGKLENVSEIDTIGVQLYYNGTRSFGLLTLEDETLTGDITSDYEIGYRVGFITGEESGVVKGETIGFDKGFDEGYRKASQVVKDPGNNTLVGMVSVLMGMPVNMLVSIYDFDFLGINLAEFFFSLITLLVSIWLIKKLL